MTLVNIWNENKKQLEDKHLQQIIAFAGDGTLKDGNSTSVEFREFLTHPPSSFLKTFIDHCLNNSFKGSGLALQDIVNEIGRRLGFTVVDGRYRGSTNQIGHDGLWNYPDGHSLIVEVKTTDTYRIDLNTISAYRKKLAEQGDIKIDKSSILIVVGREDTGDLEAQIRGSKHAWDIRLISVDALTGLLQLKEDVEDPGTVQRIYDVLIPREYTKLDEIIDLLFSTAEEIKSEDLSESDVEVDDQEIVVRDVKPVSFNEACVSQIAKAKSISYIRRSPATFSTADKKNVLVCAVSKEYTRTGSGYWFAFHKHHKELLDNADVATVAFGCGSEDYLLVIPYNNFSSWLEGMNTTENERRFYWQVHISRENNNFILQRKKGESQIDLSKYILED